MFKSLTNLTATGFAPCFAHKSDGRAHTEADSQCASPDPDHSQPCALANSAFFTVLTVPITRAPGWRAQWLKRYRCPLECLATDRGKAIERSISYLANGRGMRDRSVLATGIAPSRISTDSTQMPQSAVLRPISPRNSSSAALRSDKSADNIDDPIISRSEVLGDPIDGFAVVGDVQSRLLRVVDEPEDDRVDVQRDGIFRQRLSALKPVV